MALSRRALAVQRLQPCSLHQPGLTLNDTRGDLEVMAKSTSNYVLYFGEVKWILRAEDDFLYKRVGGKERANKRF